MGSFTRKRGDAVTMIGFGGDLKDYSFARSKEYLLTSAGSYCSSSLAGNTRKYHGLLVHDRRVYLSTLDERANGGRLSSARYKGALCDEGLMHLKSFDLYPPRFHYFMDGNVIRKTISFDGSLTVRYDVIGECELKVVPLVADRGYHETRLDYDIQAVASDNGFTAGKLKMSSGMQFVEKPQIYYDVWYDQDYERGYEHMENLFAPGYFIAEVKDASVEITASVEGATRTAPARIRPETAVDALKLAADSFIVGDNIIAGYHWFAEGWGRDAFVSLPGLLLDRGRYIEAKCVFRHYARYMKGGLIPNRLPDSYNTSDASLWFVYALRKYFERKRDREFLREAKAWLESIFSGYPDSEAAKLDGSLISVKPSTTWMDTAYTGREGKPVEVNALWVDALHFADALGMVTPVDKDSALMEFQRFWNEGKGCLYDVIDPMDDSIRPNQVIATALGLLSPEKANSALSVMRRTLLTPYGLRTLASDEKGYVGRFSGDLSYHNGCVWPWLMGFYIESLLNAGEPYERLYPLLVPLMEQVRDAGLGTISEIFDGDAPNAPNGCISQSWSVAEVLRAHSMLK